MTTLQNRPWLAAYTDGVPDSIVEQTETLFDMAERARKSFRGKAALDFFGAVTSYNLLLKQVLKVAEGLRRLGVAKGDRVALVMPNCPQHVVAFYAVLRLGAIVVEHNPLYTAKELRHQFEDHGAKVAVVWSAVVDTVADFPEDVRPEHTVSVDITRAMPFTKRVALSLPIPKARRVRQTLVGTTRTTNFLQWSWLLNAPKLSRKHPRPVPNDLALIQYTSGTTGRPKGAMLSHSNLRSNAAQGRAWIPALQEGKETFYGVLPMFHAYGLTLCLTFAVSIGARLVLFPKFDVDLVLEAAKKLPPTFLPAVPPIYDRLVAEAAEHGIDLSSVRFAISGAMSLPVSTVERWESATGGYLVEGYGMTECSPVVLGNPVGPTRRPGTVGVPFPSTEIRVTNPEDSAQDLGSDEPGELLVRGPQVFQGYWNKPEETRKVLLPDGWLRTGDIVEVSPDGYVTIIDRMKELIITGGFNVAPTEVELALQTHPDILETAVVGLKNEHGSEVVTAAIVLRDGAVLNPVGLREFCRRELAGYKIPKNFVQLNELPRSLIGKVLRREVRDALLALRADADKP